MALLSVLLLLGCKKSDSDLNKALSFRQSLMSAQSTQFDCSVTADYGDKIYSFSLRCQFDENGIMMFEVLQPESITGITGKVSKDGGDLIFDNQALGFPIIADGYLSPVSAPWLFMKSLRSGYISSCGRDGDGYRLRTDDSFETNPLQIEIWLNQNFTPIRGEFLWLGKRILTLEVSNFTYM